MRFLLAILLCCAVLAPAASGAAPAASHSLELPLLAPECQPAEREDDRLVPVPHELVVERDRADVVLDGTVSITPRIDVDTPLQPGDSFVCTVTIRNRMSKAATFRLEPRGILGARSAAIGRRFVEVGDDDADSTAVGWIEPATERLAMEPGTIARVPVVITVPEGAPVGGAYAAIDIIASTGQQDLGDGTALGIETARQVSMLLQVGGEGRPKLALHDVRAPRTRWNRDPWTLRADLDNDGTLHTIAAGRVRIRSLFGSTVATLPIPAATVLPNGRVPVQATWDGVPWFGIYRYDVRVEGVGTGATTRSGWFVALPPVWVLAVGGALLLVGVVGLVRRRRFDGSDLDDEDSLEEFRTD